MDDQTVEAVSSREVGFTVQVLPWPKRWSKILAHLQQFHGASTPRGPVLAPSRLADWHRQDHASEDAWTAEGNPTATPHLHENLAGRLRLWWEFRS